MPDETQNGTALLPDLPLKIRCEAKITNPKHPDSPAYFERGADNTASPDQDNRKLEKTIREALEVRLPKELRDTFGVVVTVQYEGNRQGSFFALFLVIWETFSGAVEFVAKYKDFYEGIELIRTQAARVLESALRLADFPYDVTAEIPNKQLLRVTNAGFAGPGRARPLLGRALARPGLVLLVAVAIIILELGVIGSLLYYPAGKGGLPSARARPTSHAQALPPMPARPTL